MRLPLGVRVQGAISVANPPALSPRPFYRAGSKTYFQAPVHNAAILGCTIQGMTAVKMFYLHLHTGFLDSGTTTLKFDRFVLLNIHVPRCSQDCPSAALI